MKIAVVTNDQTTICPHFGRATHYLVYTVEQDTVVKKESRPKAGHHTAHSHHEADDRHRQMVEAIQDCQAVIVGGMGQGARAAMDEAGITPCSTAVTNAEEAVRAYLAGGSVSVPDCTEKAAHSQ